MKTFFNVEDLGDLKAALAEAQEVKANRFGYQELGKNKTLLMIFFNNSLRTRLSTQKAAMNLGMNVIVLDVNAGAWKLETERGVIMDGDKSEHLLEAIPVMGSFCDLIGVRSFAGLKDRDYDYAETIVNQFVKYSGRPVFAMETATVHPLQAFADLITIEEHKKVARPKVVLTWAPHCRALPQAVPNSFAQWMNAADVDFVVTHPEGYELDPKFVGNAKVEYDQKKALEGADFVYAKNWSCPGVKDPAQYGEILSKDMSWTIDEEHMSWTNDGCFQRQPTVRFQPRLSSSVCLSHSKAGNKKEIGEVKENKPLLPFFVLPPHDSIPISRYFYLFIQSKFTYFKYYLYLCRRKKRRRWTNTLHYHQKLRALSTTASTFCI